MKKWKKPELIIISRGRPEEVLTSDCKHPGVVVGPGLDHNECSTLELQPQGNYECKVCHSQNNKS